MWLTRLALKYPISTLMAALAVLVLGVVSFSQLPVDMLPNISVPVVSVITFYNGAGPLDMEQTVTVPIERGVSSTNDVDYVQSSSREGVSQIRVNFNWQANTDVGLIDVIQKVNRVLNLLPAGTGQPLVLRFDITNVPVCQVALSGDMDERDLYDIAYNVIEPQLEHLPGVAFAQVVGGRIREIHVTLDRNRAEALGLPIQDVINAVAQSNLILPSGDLKSGTLDYSLKTETQFNVVEPMGDVVIKAVGGVPIRMRDVARIEDSYMEQTEIIRNNGQHGVLLKVQKTSGANTIDVVDNVTKTIANFRGVPPAVKASLASDQSLYIRQAIGGLQRETLMGAFLAICVILIYLRNLRSAIIIFVAIPLSILATFIFFRFEGVTLNIMTIGGLALGVGRLVDDSIVELEAISRHFHTMEKDGLTKIEATLAAASEVAAPIFISTLATVIVFLPVVFLVGISKLLFIPLVLTIAVALFSSFFVSRTVTPLLCLTTLKPEHIPDRDSKKFFDILKLAAERYLTAMDQAYERVLEFSLGNRKLIIFSILAISAGSFLLFGFVGSEFFPDSDESQFTINVKLPVGSRVEETERFVQSIEKVVSEKVPEAVTVVSDLGVPNARSGNLFGANTGSHAANVQVNLSPPDERKRSSFQIMAALRPVLSKMPGAQMFVLPGGFLRFLLNFGSSAPLDVLISGYDFAAANKLSTQVAEIVRSTPGATDVQITRENNLPSLRVVIDRDKAGALGITASQISNTVAGAISGSVASIYSDPKSGNQYNILVRLSEDYRNKVDDIMRLTVAGSAGQLVKLGNVAQVIPATTPVQIDRRYQERIVEVTGNVTGRDLGSVADEIKAKLGGISIPTGFNITMSGNVEQQSKAFRGLLLAFGLAIILVYMVMASQFQSLVDPFIIMFSVPLGMVGVIWSLFLTNTTLSVTSFEGIIVMVGIVVSNGILLVDYTNHLRKAGVELHEAVIRGGRTRLRPIMMTTLATVVGLLPIALGVGGESSQGPLAIAVIGGLTISTFLTLIFVPTLYTVFEERFQKKAKASVL